MKKRINSTGRRKIEAEQIDIRLSQPDGQSVRSFSASLDLSSFGDLDKSAKVYVEPYVRTSSMRFDFGTVGSPKVPADSVLSELDNDGSLLFRVKVVDESGVLGRILASANGIHARDTDEDGFNRKTILPLRTTDTGESIWRIAYDSATGPILEISNRIPGFSARVKTDPLLQGMLYPQALREVLRKILIEDPPEDEVGWLPAWRDFVKAISPLDIIEDELEDDDAPTRIDEIVTNFCTAHRFATAAAKVEEVAA